MIGLRQEVMPFVRFEQRDHGKNIEASEKAGIFIPNRLNFIVITSHGSKDSSDHIADEWLPRKRDEANRGNYNMAWVEHFEKQYEGWKKGHEIPRDGTAVLTWQAISPEQNARLRALGYTTVEDLSALPDSALGSIGLDGRELRDKARAWLNEGKDKGINAQLIAEQAVKIDDQKALIDELRQRLAVLEAKEDAPRRGRPPKQEAA